MRLPAFVAAIGFATLLGCGKDEPSAQMETDTDTDTSSTGVDSSTTGCSQDEDCPMGERCDEMTGECVAPLPTPDSTENPAPPDFEDKVIPFFRGRVCMVHSIEAGSLFPIYVNPCMHPCIGASSVEYRESWSCDETPCRANVVMWVTGSSIEECPADAFARFDKAECVYMTPIEFSIEARVAGEPVVGEMRFEIPYLSNEDVAMIAAHPNDVELREQLISQYVSDDNRVAGGMNIDLHPDNPVPPATCSILDMQECDCFDVGF